MTNDVKIDIKVDDGGSTAALTKLGEKLKGVMKEAADVASSIRVPMATAAAQQGVTGSSAPRKAAAQPGGGASDTNLSRGVAGQTGAGGRDFAAQAQGLGGLVHVYATFAANLFAVSAAFGALSKAADTTNMVKGLDQLGAASGKALGSLSKQMVAVTDGALSLRAAMSSTAMASSGGMTNAAILRMTEVARKASLALGRDMPDSMDRLTKGIVKIQPELLDELGIMTRVLPAQEAYAKSIGKAASSLTDFEKRQAFANAVLDEGEKKFGAIKLDTNPYSKLLASTQNIAQSFLEIINVPLGWALRKIADNSMLLGAALLWVGKALLTQAMPALMAYRGSLSKMAEESKKVAEASRLSANIQYNAQVDLVRKSDDLAGKAGVAKFKTAKETEDRIAVLQSSKLGKFVGADVKTTIATKSPFDFTEQDLSIMKARSAKILEEDTTLGKKRNAVLQKSIAEIENIQAGSEKARSDATAAYQAKDRAGDKAVSDSHATAAKLNQKFSMDSIKASTAEVQSREGAVSAFKHMTAQLALANAAGGQQVFTGLDKDGKAITELVPKIGAAKVATEVLSGTFGIAKRATIDFAGKLGGMLDKLGIAGQVIGIAIAGFELLDSWLSTGAKEIEKYGNSLVATKDSTKTLKDTNAALLVQDTSKWLSAESMMARSTAIAGASDSIKDMLKNLKEAKIASSWWDNLFDGLIGKSRIQKTAIAITDSIKEAVSLSRPSEAKTIFEKRVSEITGATSAESIQPSKLTEENLKSLSVAYALFSSDIAKSAEKLAAPKKAFDALGDAMQDISLSLMPTDKLSKFGIALMNVGTSLQAAAGDTHNYFEELVRVSQDASKLSLLPGKQGVELAKQTKELQNLQASYIAIGQALTTISAAKEKAGKLTEVVAGGSFKAGPTIGAKAVADVAALGASEASIKVTLDLLDKKIEAKSQEFASLAGAALREGGIQFSKALEITVAEGALKIASAVAGSITGLGSAEAKAQVALKDIALRNSSNDIMIKLIEENQKNTLAIADNTTIAELSLTEAKLKVLKDSNLKSDQAEILTLEAKKKNLLVTKANIELAITWVSDPKADLMKKLSTAKTAEEIGASGLVKGTAQQLAKAKADKSVLGSEAEVVSYNKKLGIVAETYTSINRTQQNNISLLESQQKIADQLASSGNSMELQSIANLGAENLEREKGKLLLNAQKQLDSEHAIKLSKAGGLTELETKSYNDQVAALKEKTAEQNASNAAAKLSRDIADIIKQSAITSYELEGKRLVQEHARAKELGSVTNAQAELESLRSIGAINDIIYAQEKGVLDLRALSVNKAIELAAIDKTATIEAQAAQDKLNTGNAAALEITDRALQAKALLELQNQYVKALARARATQAASIALADAKLLTDTKISVQQTANNTLLAVQANQMAKMVTLTETLSAVFGTLGESIGKVGETLLSIGVSETKLAQQKQAALDALSKEGPPDPAKLAKTEMEYDNKATQLKLGNTAKLAGSTKKLFAEHTFAYKALNALEKVSSAMKMAMDLKELAFSLGILTTKVTAEGVAETSILGMKIATAPAKVAADAPSILSSFSTMGPPGYAIGAALVAALLGMVGGGGGGTQVDMTGLTSADRQSTQGTGQAWVGGLKTDTGGGVFGDSSAKSTAIVDSLEIMKSNSIEGLNYDNKMLKALEKLADSVVGAAKSLYAVPGLRAGTGFGTAASETSTGGFGSSIPVVGKILGSIFGGGTSSSTSITSAGIQLKGTFDQVMNDTEGSIMQYKDVLNNFHRDGGWFGSDSNWSTLNTETNKLRAEASTAISDIFKDANALFVEIGTKTGVSVEQISSQLKSIDISMPIDVMNLTGQALVDELNAVIGDKLSGAAKQIFSGFDKYKNFGEDYLATVVRVVDSNNKLDQALRSIGASFSILAKFDVSEAMIKAAGGLETFMEQASFFKDNFLSEAEKLAPVQKAVTDQLAKLHISSTISREDFKKLALSQNLSTQAGQDLYQSLMEIAPGFDIVTKAAEATTTATVEAAKVAAEARTSSEIAIYTALGDTESALTLTRAKELEAISDILKPAQKYLYALQNEATLKGKLTTAYTKESTAIKSTITALTASIKTITAYKASLTAGALSVLTPSEKYVQAKMALINTAALANAVITSTSTTEEITARDAALSQISSTSDAFLTLSKEMFASSDRYLQDFSSVTDILDSTNTSLTNQETDAQKQLTALDASVSALNLIQVSTDTTATLLAEYLALQTATEAARIAAVSSGSTAASSTFAIPAHANGGIGMGVSLVGEKGPEIVDFKNPGRVYSNRASNDLLNTKDLVAEIKALREEVCQLRADQKEQTGHIIATNYDANSRNANTVSTANEDALIQQNWKARSQVKIA